MYISTRGRAPDVNFSDATLAGLAPDGGLYVPKRFPVFSFRGLEAMRSMAFVDLAYEIATAFQSDDDIPRDEFYPLVRKAYATELWGSDYIAPIRKLREGIYVLELFHGPTLAFKDFGMQFLASVLEDVLKKQNRTTTILGATSGDTGAAAIEAFRGKAGVSLFMLFPDGAVSDAQRRQMTTASDRNIFPVAIRGSFDVCQDIVRALNAEKVFRTQFQLGAVNSFNWARIVAQVVYYFWAYFKVAERDGEEVTFAVPTGNFGNVYAGWVARRMGLPIRLILATNENDVLVDFFHYGLYRPRPEERVIHTEAPAIDIANASNVWRLIFEITDRDASRVRVLGDEVKKYGLFRLGQHDSEFKRLCQSGISARATTKKERAEMIKSLWNSYRYMIDPHTAAGVVAGMEQYRSGTKTKLICLATASPAKFSETMKEILGFEPEIPERLAKLMGREERFVTLPASADAVKRYIEEQVPRAA